MALAWDVSMEDPIDPIADSRELLLVAKRVLVVTGAGISAESGVPTFRGPGGYWRNRHFSELACPEAFARDPRLVWEWYCERRRTVAACKPNTAHIALAEWAKRREGVTLVTQNVDGLHERAGHPDVIRMHGSLWKNRCTECGIEREVSELSYDQMPRSPCCNANERPAIVWFGEMIPAASITRASTAAVDADAVLVIGTSGIVYPAAGLAATARRHGASVINVNPDATNIDAEIDLRSNAGDVIPLLVSSHP